MSVKNEENMDALREEVQALRKQIESLAKTAAKRPRIPRLSELLTRKMRLKIIRRPYQEASIDL